MKKKGQSEFLQLNLLFEVLLALLIGAIFVMGGLGFNMTAKSDKVLLKKDMELTINAMLSAPGELKIAYLYPKDYDFKINDEEVSVSRDVKQFRLTGKDTLILQKNYNLGPIMKGESPQGETDAKKT